MIKMDLSRFLARMKRYSELRIQDNSNIILALLNGNLVRNEKNKSRGVSARVFDNGSWGFASKAETKEPSIEQTIFTATQNARFLAEKSDVFQDPYTSPTIHSTKDFSTKKNRWSQAQIMQYLQSVDAFIAKQYPDLLSRLVVLNCLDIEKHLITTGGTTAILKLPRTVLYIRLSTQKDGSPCEMMDIFGGKGNLEDHLSEPEGLSKRIDALHEKLMEKNEGVHPISGFHDVILDADLAGILAHEAFGHTVEADLVRNGSIAGDYLNKEVASPLVSLSDFAHTFQDEDTPCPIFIDDEGIECKDAHIVERGVLKAYLHNRDSAHQMGHEPLGNARAWSFSDEPLIRMRNTAILPGSSKLEEMIASIDDGYYFTKTSNGQADMTGEFMFGVTAGYEIKSGKLGKAVKDTTISGKAFDVLSSVAMVSDEMKWNFSGMCGKKQMIPVGMGGPAIKCQISVGGK